MNTIPVISTLLVDLECEGYNNQPAGMPAIHSGDSMQLYDVAPIWNTYPGIGFDITLRDQSGVQFRGKRSKLFLPNCTFDKWAWSRFVVLFFAFVFVFFSFFPQRYMSRLWIQTELVFRSCCQRCAGPGCGAAVQVWNFFCLFFYGS
jgi:hypothetical protein